MITEYKTYSVIIDDTAMKVTFNVVIFLLHYVNFLVKIKRRGIQKGFLFFTFSNSSF